ncbi:RNA polymerase sigma factor [Chitinophaga sp. SYP-B3965]|uniref:RNA polymerase sigma factor n=1 Tax=Chitinophaga sp. SYP-B3965 TaxID=2663120 RepID=UPI001563B540|nr:sigma-70 family RNA polymerase sigma factor [Chitinophaga sp. SYP-B3965]
MRDTNDIALLALLKDGDETAFTEIYNHYWEPLYFMAHKRLQSAQDAEEIVQQVFLTLWQKRADLSIQSLPFYLAAMVRYAIYRHFANLQRKREQTNTLQTITAEQSPAFDIENKYLLEILNKLASELPAKHRIVFLQHKLLDRPLEEVAGELGVSVRTAEGYIARVMQVMRQRREYLSLAMIFMLIK